MRILLCLCGAGVFGAALILVPMHPPPHDGFAPDAVTGSAAATSVAASADSSASSRAAATPEKGPFLGFDRNIYPADFAQDVCVLGILAGAAAGREDQYVEGQAGTHEVARVWICGTISGAFVERSEEGCGRETEGCDRREGRRRGGEVGRVCGEHGDFFGY